MATKKRKKPSPEFITVFSKITHYNVSTNSGINFEIDDPRMAHDDSLVFYFYTHIELHSDIIYPEERLAHKLRLDVYGQERCEGMFATKLGDYHVRGEDGQRKYKKRGNREVPVYNAPDSIGYIQKTWGAKAWTGAVWLPPDLVNSMITLLSTHKTLYIDMNEINVDKRRAIRNLLIQNNQPE